MLNVVELITEMIKQVASENHTINGRKKKSIRCMMLLRLHSPPFYDDH